MPVGTRKPARDAGFEMPEVGLEPTPRDEKTTLSRGLVCLSVSECVAVWPPGGQRSARTAHFPRSPGSRHGETTIGPDHVAKRAIDGSVLEVVALYHDGKSARDEPTTVIADLMTEEGG